MYHEEDMTHTAFAFIAGAAVGAGVTLLLTPQAGPEIRSSVAQYARKAKDELEHISGQGGDALSTMLRRGKEWIEGILSKDVAAGRRPTQEGIIGSGETRQGT